MGEIQHGKDTFCLPRQYKEINGISFVLQALLGCDTLDLHHYYTNRLKTGISAGLVE